MELNIAGISKNEGFVERFEITDVSNQHATIRFCGEDLEILSPIKVTGSAVNYEGKIKAEVHITTKVARTCSRCLERFEEDIRVDTVFIFVKEARDDNEDFYVIKSDKIDITELVLGEIAGEIVMKPLCKSDCKGLCPVCGKNRNADDCQCEGHAVDSRLQALSKLLDKDNG